MKATTRMLPMMPAILPAWMESWPRPGPTVRSSMMVSVGRQRAGAQQHGEIVGALRREIAGDLAAAAEDRLADLRRRDHLVVEDDGEQPADILLRRLAETLRALAVEAEGDDRLAGALVEGRLRVDQVFARHDDAVLDQVGNRRIVLRIHDR